MTGMTRTGDVCKQCLRQGRNCGRCKGPAVTPAQTGPAALADAAAADTNIDRMMEMSQQRRATSSTVMHDHRVADQFELDEFEAAYDPTRLPQGPFGPDPDTSVWRDHRLGWVIQDGMDIDVGFWDLKVAPGVDPETAAKSAFLEAAAREQDDETYEVDPEACNWGDVMAFTPDEVFRSHGIARAEDVEANPSFASGPAADRANPYFDTPTQAAPLAGSPASEAREFVDEYNRQRAMFTDDGTVDGDIDDNNYADWDETRNELGEQAVHLLEQIARNPQPDRLTSQAQMVSSNRQASALIEDTFVQEYDDDVAWHPTLSGVNDIDSGFYVGVTGSPEHVDAAVERLTRTGRDIGLGDVHFAVERPSPGIAAFGYRTGETEVADQDAVQDALFDTDWETVVAGPHTFSARGERYREARF